jgi:hypothetical protein
VSALIVGLAIIASLLCGFGFGVVAATWAVVYAIQHHKPLSDTLREMMDRYEVDNG